MMGNAADADRQLDDNAIAPTGITEGRHQPPRPRKRERTPPTSSTVCCFTSCCRSPSSSLSSLSSRDATAMHAPRRETDDTDNIGGHSYDDKDANSSASPSNMSRLLPERPSTRPSSSSKMRGGVRYENGGDIGEADEDDTFSEEKIAVGGKAVAAGRTPSGRRLRAQTEASALSKSSKGLVVPGDDDVIPTPTTTVSSSSAPTSGQSRLAAAVSYRPGGSSAMHRRGLSEAERSRLHRELAQPASAAISLASLSNTREGADPDEDEDEESSAMKLLTPSATSPSSRPRTGSSRASTSAQGRPVPSVGSAPTPGRPTRRPAAATATTVMTRKITDFFRHSVLGGGDNSPSNVTTPQPTSSASLGYPEGGPGGSTSSSNLTELAAGGKGNDGPDLTALIMNIQPPNLCYSVPGTPPMSKPRGSRRRVLALPMSEAEEALFECPMDVWRSSKRTSFPAWKCSVSSPVTLKKISDQLCVEHYCGLDAKHPLLSKLFIYRGGVTDLGVDAMVNAANEQCMGGGGVDGAVHRLAGPLLLRECSLFSGCETGHTRLTKGYLLPARFVLHTVGPIGENPAALSSCYTTCLSLCRRNHLKSIAFCCISTGIFGYPLEKAAKVAILAVTEFLLRHHRDFTHVIFACYKPEEQALYERLVPQIVRKKFDAAKAEFRNKQLQKRSAEGVDGAASERTKTPAPPGEEESGVYSSTERQMHRHQLYSPATSTSKGRELSTASFDSAQAQLAEMKRSKQRRGSVECASAGQGSDTDSVVPMFPEKEDPENKGLGSGQGNTERTDGADDGLLASSSSLGSSSTESNLSSLSGN